MDLDHPDRDGPLLGSQRVPASSNSVSTLSEIVSTFRPVKVNTLSILFRQSHQASIHEVVLVDAICKYRQLTIPSPATDSCYAVTISRMAPRGPVFYL